MHGLDGLARIDVEDGRRANLELGRARRLGRRARAEQLGDRVTFAARRDRRVERAAHANRRLGEEPLDDFVVAVVRRSDQRALAVSAREVHVDVRRGEEALDRGETPSLTRRDKRRESLSIGAVDVSAAAAAVPSPGGGRHATRARTISVWP